MVGVTSCANVCRDARSVRPPKMLCAFASTIMLFACYHLARTHEPMHIDLHLQRSGRTDCACSRGDCNKKRAWLAGSRARCDGVWGAERPFMARRATGMDGPNAYLTDVVHPSCAGNGPISSRVLPRVRGVRRQGRVLRRCRSECHRVLFGASCNCR